MKRCILPVLASALALLFDSGQPVRASDTNTAPVASNTPPVVTVVASDPNAAEDGPDTGTFALSRTGATDRALTVFYGLDGTGLNGRDYKVLPGYATFPVGSNTVDVVITPILDNDTTAETSDTVVLQLHPRIDFIPGQLPAYALGMPSNAVVTIAESTVPRTNKPPSIHLLSPSANAGFLSTATVHLSAQAQDVDGKVVSVEFLAGTTSLGVVSNQGLSRQSVFALAWTNVPAGDYRLTAKATDNTGASTVSAAVAIRVVNAGDLPVITVTASDATASELGPDPGTFTVSRTGDTTAALAVYYTLGGTAQNGSDYQRLPGVVNFAAGAATTNISVTPIPDIDRTPQTNDTVELQLRPLLNVRGGLVGLYQVGSPSNAVVTITEDASAVPVVTVTATDAQASEDGPDPAVFELARTGNSGTPLTVYYSLGGGARNGKDYQILPGYVTFAAGDTKTNVTVIPILDIDKTKETNETVVLQVRSFRGLDAGTSNLPYYVGWPSNAVATIAESTAPPTNHPPVVHLLSPADGSGYVAPAQISIIAQARDADGTVTNVQFFAGSTSLGNVSSPAGHTRDSYAFKWTNVDVGQYVLTAVATDNEGGSSTSGPVHVVVTKTALPLVSIYAVDSLAITGTNASGKTNSAMVMVRRSGPTNDDLVVYYTLSGTATNGVDYVKLPGSVLIPAGSTSASINLDALANGTGGNAAKTAVFTLQAAPISGQNPPSYLIGHLKSATVLIIGRPAAVGSGSVRPDTFYMSVPTAVDARYRFERSADMVDWEVIGANQSSQGQVSVIDPDAANAPQYFYRVVPDTDDQQ